MSQKILSPIEASIRQPEDLKLSTPWTDQDWVVYHGQQNVKARIRNSLPTTDQETFTRKVERIYRIEEEEKAGKRTRQERWFREPVYKVIRAYFMEGLRLAQILDEWNTLKGQDKDLERLRFFLAPDLEDLMGEEGNHGGDWGDIWVYKIDRDAEPPADVWDALAKFGNPTFVIDEKSYQPDQKGREVLEPYLKDFEVQTLQNKLRQSALLPTGLSTRKARIINWIVGVSYCTDFQEGFVLGGFIPINYLYQYGQKGMARGHKNQYLLPHDPKYSLNCPSLFDKFLYR